MKTQTWIKKSEAKTWRCKRCNNPNDIESGVCWACDVERELGAVKASEQGAATGCRGKVASVAAGASGLGAERRFRARGHVETSIKAIAIVVLMVAAQADAGTVSDWLGNDYDTTSPEGWFWTGAGVGCLFYGFAWIVRMAKRSVGGEG